MKFGQLIEYNMKTLFFFEKLFTKSGGETIPKILF